MEPAYDRHRIFFHKLGKPASVSEVHMRSRNNSTKMRSPSVLLLPWVQKGLVYCFKGLSAPNPASRRLFRNPRGACRSAPVTELPPPPGPPSKNDPATNSST